MIINFIKTTTKQQQKKKKTFLWTKKIGILVPSLDG